MSFNLCFCLLPNIPLHCHSIDKVDRKKWRRLLLRWISIDWQSDNWENFTTMFCVDPRGFLKARCNILPHTLPPHDAPLYLCKWEGERDIDMLYIYHFVSTLKLDFSCMLKKEWTAFCYCCFISSVQILSEDSFFMNALISYLFFPVT